MDIDTAKIQPPDANQSADQSVDQSDDGELSDLALNAISGGLQTAKKMPGTPKIGEGSANRLKPEGPPIRLRPDGPPI